MNNTGIWNCAAGLPPTPPTYPPERVGITNFLDNILQLERSDEDGENMFAVIKSGGRQYKVSVGQKLEVNRLAVEDGKQIALQEVLLISDADNSFIGSPFVENASILATVTGQKRGEKLIVFKYKSKKRYRHRRGHRQELTVLTIDDIVANGKSLITGEAPQVKETPPSSEVEETTTKAEEGS